MPVCSTDVITPVNEVLERALGGIGGSSGNRHGSGGKTIDSALIASTKKSLLDSSRELQFVPARKSYNAVQDTLKEKYTCLNSGSATELHSNALHAASLNGKEQSKEKQMAVNDGIPLPHVVLFSADRVELKWGTMQPARTGLSNMGNTCFLNSTLQCLTFTAPLANYFLLGVHAKECKVNGFCMACEMQHHVKRCLGTQSASQTVQPLSILQKIKMIAKHMSWGRQEDAHEFLRYVIDSMQKACLAGQANLERFSKETTFVHQMFGCYLRSQVRCLQCKATSDTYDPALDVSIDIKNANSIERALQKFVQPEVLDIDNAYMCQRCRQKVRAQKRLTVHRAPQVLTLHLKRFDYHRQMGGKVTRHVEFTEKVNLRPFMSKPEGEAISYQLYAVLVHSGFSCNSGHYYCYVRAPNQTWYCMNDSSVTQASLARVLSAEAYILFYVRVLHGSSGPSSCGKQQASAAVVASLPAHVKLQSTFLSGMLNSRTPVMPANSLQPRPSASPAVNAVSEMPSAKYTNGPKILDSAPARSKVVFSMTGGDKQQPRMVMHTGKKLLPGLSSSKSELTNGTHPLTNGGTAATPAQGATSLRPLVPYRDDEEHASECMDRETNGTATLMTDVAMADRCGRGEQVNEITSSCSLESLPKKPSRGSEEKEDRQASHLSANLLSPPRSAASSSLGKAPSMTCLSPVTSCTTRVNATATNWHVVDAGLKSPTVSCDRSSSSCSNASVNSTTQEWTVQLKTECPVAPAKGSGGAAASGVPGWRVTVEDSAVSLTAGPAASSSVSNQATNANRHPSCSKQALPQKLFCATAVDAVSQDVVRCSNDSVGVQSDSKCSAVEISKSLQETGRVCHDRNLHAVHESGLATEIVPATRVGGDSPLQPSSDHGTNDDTYAFFEKAKKKKHKKHKKASKEKADEAAADDDDDVVRCRHASSSPSIKVNKKNKKHKKRSKKRRQHGSGLDDSSGSDQWVEITKANLSEKELLSASTSDRRESAAAATASKAEPRPASHNGSGDTARVSAVAVSTVSKASRWDGTKKLGVAHILEKHSTAGYGASVLSWDGSKSTLNAEAEEERKRNRKRTWHDSYEEDLDRGKVKKVKNKDEASYYQSDGNKMQHLQDMRNVSSRRWQQDHNTGKTGQKA